MSTGPGRMRAGPGPGRARAEFKKSGLARPGGPGRAGPNDF